MDPGPKPSLGLGAPWLAALALAIAGCGSITVDDDGGGQGGGSAERRVYVNDAAANDSLSRDVLLTGVRFVMQPGRNYRLSLAGKRTGDQLNLYFSNAGAVIKYKTVIGSNGGDAQVFPLASNKPDAAIFLAQLKAPEGSDALPSLGHLALASTGEDLGDVLEVRLIFVRALSGLADDRAKEAYAGDFFREMSAVYSPMGVTVQGSFEIADPTGKAMDFPFGRTYVPLPGARVAGHAHLYLVESIVAQDGAGQPLGQVLGFAPREAVDFSFDRESRVILSNRGGGVSDLATTASHELGHFLGLRHTTSTAMDLSYDRDFSNLDDGFPGTLACAELEREALQPPAAKAAAGEAAPKYCIRTARPACPSECDVANLMFPYDCRDPANPQRGVGPEQALFFRKNLALYP